MNDREKLAFIGDTLFRTERSETTGGEKDRKKRGNQRGEGRIENM
ncbi:hypothetical protein ABE547_09935 [Dorea sp. YH-dor226]